MGNPPLVVGLLIHGVAYAVIFIVVTLLISRFVGELAWRSFLVLFLFIAAGLYIVFAVRAGEGVVWMVGELVGWLSSAVWPCSGCAARCGGSSWGRRCIPFGTWGSTT